MSEYKLRKWLEQARVQGVFWDASNPDRRVPGLIELSDRRPPRLLLWDSLAKIEPDGAGMDWPVRQEVALVHGRTTQGKVTLLDATADHFSNIDGYWFGTLTARAAFLGDTYEAGDVDHRHFRVRLDGLDLLVPFAFATRKEERPLFHYTVDLSQTVVGQPAGMTVTVQMQSTSAGWSLGESSGSRGLLSVEVIVDGEADEPLDLDAWTDGFINPLHHLVGFALGKLTVLRSVQRVDRLAHPAKSDETYADERPLIGTGIGLNDEPVERLLHGPLVSFRDDQIIERWWDLWSDERKRDVVQRLANAARPGTSPKSRFNDLAEAAEGWHKAVHSGDVELRDRLDALLAPLATWKVDRSLLSSRKEIVKARNAVAHGDVLPEVSKASQTLRMLVRYHIAVSLGIEPDKAGERVVNAENWSWR